MICTRMGRVYTAHDKMIGISHKHYKGGTNAYRKN